MENVILVRPVEWPRGRRVAQWSLMAQRQLRTGTIAESAGGQETMLVIRWDDHPGHPEFEYAHLVWPETWTQNMIQAFYEQEAQRTGRHF